MRTEHRHFGSLMLSSSIIRISIGAAPNLDHLNRGPCSDLLGWWASAGGEATALLLPPQFALPLRVTKRFLETANLAFTCGWPIATSPARFLRVLQLACERSTHRELRQSSVKVGGLPAKWRTLPTLGLQLHPTLPEWAHHRDFVSRSARSIHLCRIARLHTSEKRFSSSDVYGMECGHKNLQNPEDPENSSSGNLLSCSRCQRLNVFLLE